jgi:hypothetical protein
MPHQHKKVKDIRRSTHYKGIKMKQELDYANDLHDQLEYIQYVLYEFSDGNVDECSQKAMIDLALKYVKDIRKQHITKE